MKTESETESVIKTLDDIDASILLHTVKMNNHNLYIIMVLTELLYIEK